MIRYILVGLIGIILGAYLNYKVNEITNAKLLASLKAELEQYIIKAKTGKLTSEAQTKIDGLQEAINILNKK